ncbi:MAG: TIGR03087 family PEP-CTERM/XrtA system glycosyltransferase [Gammaproteobacteria bacterium]
MNVLFVCHRLPFPPKRGGKIRPFNIIRHLHEQGHQVTVASLARSAEELREGQGLADHCTRTMIETVSSTAAWARMLLRLPTRVPSSMGYFYSPRLAARIRAAEREQKFDLVIVHCSSVAGYVADLRGPAKLFDLGDIDSQKWLIYSRRRRFPLAAGYWLEGVKLEREEQRLARQFDLCTCTTRAELQTFDDFDTGVDSGWFPNGVDTDYFSPGSGEYDSNLVCFVGRMDYFPNQEAMFRFCREVWPDVRRARPEARLRIVGASPSPGVQKLAELPGVEVTGSVDDVRPHVREAALTVAPLSIARGTQNKILESMAMGVPVLASAEAAPGVDAVPDEHLLVADDPAQYRDGILRLLSDGAERQRFADAGRARVVSNHDWRASMRKLDGLVERCIENRRRRGPVSNGDPV